MRFDPPLEAGTLIRRYKRFLADIIDASGRRRTIHCANTGAMTGCAEPGSRVWYSTSDNPRRKYAHTLELVGTEAGELICVNTLRANALFAEALGDGTVPGFAGGVSFRREVPLANASGRLDFVIAGDDVRRDLYVEVKSVTLKLAGNDGAFPDAVSERATRHANALASLAAAGERALLVFCVLHTGIQSVRPAEEIDPTYASALRRAISLGVAVKALRAQITPKAMTLAGELPFTLPAPIPQNKKSAYRR